MADDLLERLASDGYHEAANELHELRARVQRLESDAAAGLFAPLGSGTAERLAAPIAAITNEWQHQNIKWGSGKAQSLAGYLMILRREADEAIDGWMKNAEGRHAPLAEVVQVATVALRCLADYGTRGSARSTMDITETEMRLERQDASERRFGSR